MHHISNYDAEQALRAMDLGEPVSPEAFTAAMSLRLREENREFETKLDEATTEAYEDGKAEFEPLYKQADERADALWKAIADEAIPMLNMVLNFIEDHNITGEHAERLVARIEATNDTLEGVLFDE